VYACVCVRVCVCVCACVCVHGCLRDRQRPDHSADSTYEWVVPTTFADGDYQLKVTSVINNPSSTRCEVVAYSNYFNVTRCSLVLTSSTRHLCTTNLNTIVWNSAGLSSSYELNATLMDSAGATTLGDISWSSAGTRSASPTTSRSHWSTPPSRSCS